MVSPWVFLLSDPRLGDQEAITPEMPTSADKEPAPRTACSLARGLGKGQPARTDMD